MHQFPTLAVQQTLFGADTQNMRLTAGVQKSSLFGDGGIEHPFGESQQCSNIGPLNPMQENPAQNLLLPSSTENIAPFAIPSKDPSEALQPKLNPFGFDQEQPLL